MGDHRMLRSRPLQGGLLAGGLAAVGTLVLTGCHGLPSGSASGPPGSASSPGSMPSASPPASASSIPSAPALSLDGTEIASLTVTGEQVSGRAGAVRADTDDDVVAVCSSGEAVRYRLTVDGAEVSGGTVPCGIELRNSGVSGIAGRAQLSLDGGEGPQTLTATLALLRADAPWPGGAPAG